MFTTSAENYIRRLRIVGDVDDSLAFQLRLQSLLSSTDLSIPGVSPASIVCIRSLPDPLPRTLRLVRSELESGRAWGDALTKSIAGKVSRAERPARGAVLDNAECVLFADKAEMLACVAGDWLSGLLGARWWWQILLQAGHPSEVVKQLWREQTQYVPAALDQLQREQKAAAFVNALTDDECRELLQRTVNTFAIRELFAACQVALPGVQSKLTEIAAQPLKQTSVVSPSVPHKMITSPSEAWCSEPLPSGLSPERQRFLGIALTIVRAPSHARTAEFARAIGRWQEEIIDSSRQSFMRNLLALTPPPLSTRPQFRSTESAGDMTLPLVASTSAEVLAEQVASLDNRSLPAPERRQPDAEKTPSRDSNTSLKEDVTVQAFGDTPLHSITTPRPEPISDRAETSTQPLIADSNQRQSIALDVVSEAPWIEIETELGGFFYLINLALYLNLYGDFTRPRATVIELNIWDFVALVGEELVPDDHGQDPIWSLFAKMSARDEGESAGESFHPSDEWRLPREWLPVFPAISPWRWSTSRHRLRVAHPEGFTVLDLPLESDVQMQLCREIESYGISSTAMTRARLPKLAPLRSKKLGGQAARWLSLIMPYVRVRLRVALGCESEAAAAATLCRHYARVRRTDTHVDVFFALSDLPLSIRLAGLDRDPGWVPAAGRTIAFHFE